MTKAKVTLAAIAALLLGTGAYSQSLKDTPYVPSESNLQAREEFQDNKFGIFIHWGIYSMIGHGEWFMNIHNIQRDEYAKLAQGFYPSEFDAEKWVSAIKASGAKYITITSRHHDGFSMFGTKQSPYNIVDGTPFGRDVLKELAEECQKQGIKLNFYYSHLDWYRDDYPLGNSGRNLGRPTDKQDWKSYYEFMNGQLTELLTGYGPIGAIWFDGVWDDRRRDWQLEEQYELIHSLQPSCLIGNNHHVAPYRGEDFQMFEKDLPGQNTAGFSEGQGISALPLETCQTMNDTWGYNIEDRNYKSTETLVQFLVKSAGMNANMLLNIGPQPNGELPQMALQRLSEIGAWMDTYGETIYGTRGGDVAPHSWGVSTRKGNRLFIHILDYEDTRIFLPMEAKVTKAAKFVDGTPVQFTQDKEGVTLKLPEIPSGVDYVVELSLK